MAFATQLTDDSETPARTGMTVSDGRFSMLGILPIVTIVMLLFDPMGVWFILCSVVSSGFAFVGYRLMRRSVRPQPKTDRIVIPEYEPPAGLEVLAAAFLVGRSGRAYSAQLLDFAVRGAVRIGGDAHRPNEIELVSTAGLDDLELSFVDALFGDDARPGSRVDLRRDLRLVGRRLRDFAPSVERTLVDRGLMDEWRTVAGAWWIIAVSAALATITIALFWVVVLGGLTDGLFGYGFAALGSFFAFIVVVAMRPRFKAATAAGVAASTQLAGLRDFLRLTEADRMRVLQGPSGAERIDTGDGRAVLRLNERLLPYTVIWGIEREWHKVLDFRTVDLVGVEHEDDDADDAIGSYSWMNAISPQAIDHLTMLDLRQTELEAEWTAKGWMRPVD